MPPDDSRRHVYHYWNADKTFMLVGAATFAGSYGAPLAILVMFGARESGDSQDPDVDRRASADQRYFIPVVGPWLAYKKDPSQGDGMRDLAIVLGSAQLFGIGTFLIGATGNAQFFNVRRGHATLNVAPVTARDWAGLGLNGSF